MKITTSLVLAFNVLFLSNSLLAFDQSNIEKSKKFHAELSEFYAKRNPLSMKGLYRQAQRAYMNQDKLTLSETYLAILKDAILDEVVHSALVQECISKGKISSEPAPHLTQEEQEYRNEIKEGCSCDEPFLYADLQRAKLFRALAQQEYYIFIKQEPMNNVVYCPDNQS